jgi:hypothetical protein
MPDSPPDRPAADKPLSPGARRAEMQRTRFRIAEQRARSEQAGGKPSDDEAARMVAEFYARGGQVTVVPPVEEAEAEPPKR